MGYDDHVKGYRLYDPNKNIVFTSRDVTIRENTEKEVSIKVDSGVNTRIDEGDEISVLVGDTNENQVAEEEEEEVLSNSSGELWENSESNDSNDEIPITLRRSETVPKPRKFDDYVSYFCSESSDLGSDPVTVKSALSRPDKEKWKLAMDEKLQSFQENQAWELVNVPKEGTIVQCKWVFDNKNEVRYRARLVAKGFAQKPGIDFDETFSPVVRHSTLRLLIALSIKLDLNITHLNVTTAFINGILTEKVFMMLPEGFKNSNCENKVLKLNRAIYGLKQSARAWYTRVDISLKELGYKI